MIVFRAWYAAHGCVPVVAFANGRVKAIHPRLFEVRSGIACGALRVQLPLRLAWAITIHKSQVRALAGTVRICVQRCKQSDYDQLVRVVCWCMILLVVQNLSNIPIKLMALTSASFPQ